MTSGLTGECSPGEMISIDSQLAQFVEAGTRALCAVPADLNGDGLQDWVLVLERMTEPDVAEGQRTLLIVLRQSGDRLRVVKRNNRVVLCSACGGTFDPFDRLSAGPGTFTVHHHGGSALRWGIAYTFHYSESGATWKLAEVVEVNYHSSDAEGTLEEARYTRPYDFHEIDIADFDPETWNEIY